MYSELVKGCGLCRRGAEMGVLQRIALHLQPGNQCQILLGTSEKADGNLADEYIDSISPSTT